MKDLSSVLTGLCAMALGGALIFWITPAQTVPALFASVPSSFYPDFTSAMLVLAGFALAVSGLLTPPQVQTRGAAHIALRFFTALVLLVGAMFLTPLLGFPVMGALICLVTLLLMRENRWPLVATITLAAPACVWVAFDVLLARPLP